MNSLLELRRQMVTSIEGMVPDRRASTAMDVVTTVALGYTVWKVGQVNPLMALCATVAGAAFAHLKARERSPLESVAKTTAANTVDAVIGISVICVLGFVSAAEAPRMIRWLTPHGAHSLALLIADSLARLSAIGGGALLGVSAGFTYHNYRHESV